MNVIRCKAWDCHGLPVELEAEKHFGFKSKDEIEKFGVEKFNTKLEQYLNVYVRCYECLFWNGSC